ncbi:hypothetical protein QBC44DRAFT_144648 [Cladorrhinum sp. PSN332]|nr:hypothetical protein QBC44DRAFT_144648 [Cladorrhinum sp. PSN332]
MEQQQSALVSRSSSDGFARSSTFGASLASGFSFGRSSAELSDDVKGPLGLTTLHEPAPPIAAVADIIFVHGLGGGSRKTWSFSPHPEEFWPQAWLSRDGEFCDVRVHTFGYKADWDERKESILDIHGFGKTLLAALLNEPAIRRSDTRIILVGHSMGGCVAKKAYILANQDPTASDLSRRVHSMFFLGTPHRGSDMAGLLDNVLRATFGTWGKKPFVADLTPNSAALDSINDSFRHVAPALRLWSFYETLPVRQGIGSRLVVDQYSATLQYHNEQIVPLNADHRHVCKFSTPSDPNYQIIRNALLTAVDLVRAASAVPVSYADSVPPEKTRPFLRSFLGVNSSPEGDLDTLWTLRQRDTCEWLLTKEFFTSWKSGTTHNNVLWLTGRPGVGKSVLSSYVIEQLKQAGFYCSYFIFKNTESGGSMLIESLQSLAFQMSIQDDSVHDALVELTKNDHMWNRSDEASFWRHIFLSCIFQLPCISTHFWVLDGIDECPNFESLFTRRFLATVPPGLRLFATSRPLQKITRGLVGLGPKTFTYPLTDDDTQEDIRLFLSTRLTDLDLFDNDSDRERMFAKILAKARGSFLWVRLVMQDLECAFSEEAMEAVLQDTPADLSQLYTRIMSTIMADDPKAALAKSIFKWVALSSRPLTVEELRHAIKLDVAQTVPNLAKWIPEVCGHLLYVDQNSCVRPIHDTVRNFLLAGGAELTPLVNKQEGHTSIACTLLNYLGSTWAQRRQIGKVSGGDRGNRGLWDSVTSKAGPQGSDDQTRALLGYACQFSALHVLKGTSRDGDLMSAIVNFFSGAAVLHWIEHIASTGNLSTIARSAMNLRDYLNRRTKYISPTDPSMQLIGNWVYDLIRTVAKFRQQLLSSPRSIHDLIPCMCPRESVISKSFLKNTRGRVIVQGYGPKAWEECLATIDFQEGIATSVGHGEHLFAIGMSKGQILLYDSDTAHCLQRIQHPERVRLLRFSANDSYVASCGRKQLLVWDPASGAMTHSFSLQAPPLALCFGENGDLLCALVSSEILSWCLTDTDLIPPRTFRAGTRALVLGSNAGPPAIQAAFSRQGTDTLIAFAYKGLPIMIWVQPDLVDFEPRLLGTCQPENESVVYHGIVGMCFNPRPELPVLIVSYNDGSLCLFNYETRNEICRCPQINAACISCSPDGRSLIVATGHGAVEIFEFDTYAGEITLERVSRLCDTVDDGIRGIAFSHDGLRFVDIQRQQARLWAPALLVNLTLVAMDDTLSTIASVAPGTMSSYLSPERLKQTSVIQQRDRPSITSPLVSDDSGNCIVAGKSNGEVVLFSGTAPEMWRKLHGLHASEVVHVAIDNSGTVIASADEGARVLVVKTVEPLASMISHGFFNPPALLCDHSFTLPVRQILVSPGGDRVLVGGRDWQRLLDTTTGAITIAGGGADTNPEASLPSTLLRPLGPADPANDKGKSGLQPEAFAFQHPTNKQWFITVIENTVRIYSWADFSELTSTEGIKLERPPQVPSVPFHTSQNRASYYVGPDFVLEMIRDSPGSKPKLYTWPVAVFDPALAHAKPRSNAPGLDAISANMLHVLGITHVSKVVFLDVNMWLCSVELPAAPSPFPAQSNAKSGGTTMAGVKAERHFFALSEWRAKYGKMECVHWVKAKANNGRPSFVSVAFANGDSIVIVTSSMTHSETVDAATANRSI